MYDTCQEMYFQYAKIQPYLKESRKGLQLPEWMATLESVIEGSDERQEEKRGDAEEY